MSILQTALNVTHVTYQIVGNYAALLNCCRTLVNLASWPSLREQLLEGGVHTEAQA